MASMFLKKLLGVFPLNSVNHLSEKGDERYFVLNSIITEIFLQVTEWIHPPADLCDKFLEFVENTLLGKITKSTRSNRSIHEKNLLALLPFIPKLVSRVDNDWRDSLLQAFTQAYKDCKPESPLKLACISRIEEMIIPKQGIQYLSVNDPEIYNYQFDWISELPSLLHQLGDKHPSSSQAVLQLVLRLGQHGFLNPSRTFEDDFRNFYSKSGEEDNPK
ncbi:PREDICTED: uncharacterized protein LOC104824536 [Tarenaya hassleriana]|uniref:uncharacterized protein LOC104824536 n=1 Tax=Tarenaya hassleriana TaxID=28532 RepID=UPI00053C481A|nr:PREDICTED: uncharacterized protein LOC104824536 [Tarenaya hassleriana]